MIEAKNLTMYYGATCAVNDVSFKVADNEIVGFLGPNGAGKTTLMRILTTYIYPSKGTALINGVDILQDPIGARKLLGYLPETPPLYADMRVDEYMAFIGRARGLSGASYKQRKDWVVPACGISPVWKHMIYELSLGFRQRVGLAQALLHDPKVVILDEPTSGLDPIQIIGIRQLMQQLSKEKTILFSTHILQEASAISNRLMIINQGRLMVQGTVSELRASGVKKEEIFHVTLEAPKAEAETSLSTLAGLKRVLFLEEYQSSPRFEVASVSYAETVRAINDLVKAKNWRIKELARMEPTLEEVFLNTFKKPGKRQEEVAG